MASRGRRSERWTCRYAAALHGASGHVQCARRLQIPRRQELLLAGKEALPAPTIVLAGTDEHRLAGWVDGARNRLTRAMFADARSELGAYPGSVRLAGTRGLNAAVLSACRCIGQRSGRRGPVVLHAVHEPSDGGLEDGLGVLRRPIAIVLVRSLAHVFHERSPEVAVRRVLHLHDLVQIRPGK